MEEVAEEEEEVKGMMGRQGVYPWVSLPRQQSLREGGQALFHETLGGPCWPQKE